MKLKKKLKPLRPSTYIIHACLKPAVRLIICIYLYLLPLHELL